MAISMNKGNKIAIQKDNGINKAHFGLNWDVRKIPGPDYDLDFFFVLVGANGKAAYGDNNNSLVFYNRKELPNKSVYVLEDNRTGADTGSGAGYYDEQGFIVFKDVPSEVKEIIAAVSIYEYSERRQNFGQVNNARFDILNGETNTVIATGDLSEDMANYTGIICCRFRREADGNWSVKSVMEPVATGMSGIISQFGMSA